jgi:hypothetical protein
MAFKNPIAPRIKESKEKNPWNFQAPCYDNRNMISAGDNYGVGFNQPVGHKGNPKQRVDVLPFGKVATDQVDNMSQAKIGMYGKAKDTIY